MPARCWPPSVERTAGCRTRPAIPRRSSSGSSTGRRGLAEDGKVVCVRLALFAEMMKGRPWTEASLREVGGSEGVGVTFLEETFAAQTAPGPPAAPEGRPRRLKRCCRTQDGHQGTHVVRPAAAGFELRPAAEGVWRSVAHPGRRDRLITPIDPEGADEETPPGPNERPGITS